MKTWIRLGILLLTTAFICSAADKIDVTVPRLIPALKQPKSNDCWITAATMLVSWKENTSLEIADVAARAGAEFKTIFDTNTGLFPDKQDAFLNSLKLKSEAPQNYSVQGWADLLKERGPLWVTTGGHTLSGKAWAHARILTKMKGDGSVSTLMTFIDPAKGKETTQPVNQFVKEFEALARIDLGETGDLRPQVIHF